MFERSASIQQQGGRVTETARRDRLFDRLCPCGLSAMVHSFCEVDPENWTRSATIVALKPDRTASPGEAIKFAANGAFGHPNRLGDQLVR